MHGYDQQNDIRQETPTPLIKQDEVINALHKELKNAKAGILFLEIEVGLLKKKCSKNNNSIDRFRIERIKNTYEDVFSCTSFACYGIFYSLLAYLGPASCDINLEEEQECAVFAT